MQVIKTVKFNLKKLKMRTKIYFLNNSGNFNEQKMLKLSPSKKNDQNMAR